MDYTKYHSTGFQFSTFERNILLDPRPLKTLIISNNYFAKSIEIINSMVLNIKEQRWKEHTEQIHLSVLLETGIESDSALIQISSIRR